MFILCFLSITRTDGFHCTAIPAIGIDIEVSRTIVSRN